MGVACSTSGDALFKSTFVLERSLSVIPEFSDTEKALIRSVWDTLERRSDELATDIFLRIFELRPDIKEFFPFRAVTGDELVKHPYFKGHSIRFINAVRMTVSNMDAWEVIHIPNLRQLGQYHSRIPGFTHDIFEVFYYAMNDVWEMYLGQRYDDRTRIVWSRIFRFIINQVELGYIEELDLSSRSHNADVVLANDVGAAKDLTPADMSTSNLGQERNDSEAIDES